MRDDQRDREIDESILTEHDSADHGQIGEDRQIQLRRRHDLLADKARADQARQTDAENRERQAGGDLVDRESEREDGENRRQRRAGQRCRRARRPASSPTYRRRRSRRRRP